MSEAFDPRDQALQKLLLENGILFPPEFKQRVRELILQGMKNVPYDQILGAQLLRGKATPDFGDDGVSGDTGGVWVSCSPVHDIGGLADGRYLIMFGGTLGGAGSAGMFAGVAINGTDPDDDEAMFASFATTSAGQMLFKTLDNDDNNTVEIKVKGSNASSAGLTSSWIAVLRLGNV